MMGKQAKSCGDCHFYREGKPVSFEGLTDKSGLCFHPRPKRVPFWVSRAIALPLVSAGDGRGCPTFDAKEGYEERYRKRSLEAFARKETKGMGVRRAAQTKKWILETLGPIEMRGLKAAQSSTAQEAQEGALRGVGGTSEPGQHGVGR